MGIFRDNFGTLHVTCDGCGRVKGYIAGNPPDLCKKEWVWVERGKGTEVFCVECSPLPKVETPIEVTADSIQDGVSRPKHDPLGNAIKVIVAIATKRLRSMGELDRVFEAIATIEGALKGKGDQT